MSLGEFIHRNDDWYLIKSKDYKYKNPASNIIVHELSDNDDDNEINTSNNDNNNQLCLANQTNNKLIQFNITNNNSNNGDNNENIKLIERVKKLENKVNQLNETIYILLQNKSNKKKKKLREIKNRYNNNETALILRSDALKLQKSKLKKLNKKKRNKIIKYNKNYNNNNNNNEFDDTMEPKIFKNHFQIELKRKVMNPELKPAKHYLQQRSLMDHDPHKFALQKLCKEMLQTKANLKSITPQIKTVLVLD